MDYDQIPEEHLDPTLQRLSLVPSLQPYSSLNYIKQDFCFCRAKGVRGGRGGSQIPKTDCDVKPNIKVRSARHRHQQRQEEDEMFQKAHQRMQLKINEIDANIDRIAMRKIQFLEDFQKNEEQMSINQLMSMRSPVFGNPPPMASPSIHFKQDAIVVEKSESKLRLSLERGSIFGDKSRESDNLFQCSNEM